MSYIHTDGVEYSDDKKTLIRCPRHLKEVYILDTVTRIEGYYYDEKYYHHGYDKDGFWVESNYDEYYYGLQGKYLDAFFGCDQLTSIYIPDNVTYITKEAFKHCSSLTALVVGLGNPKYDSRGDCNGIIDTEKNELVFALGSTVIPNSVTSIGERAFEGCKNLTSVTIPESVKCIGDGAFRRCKNLISVVIPDSVTEIGGGVFYGCCELKNVILSNRIKSLDCLEEWIDDNFMGGFVTSGFFAECTSLESISLPEGLKRIGNKAFENCTSLKSISIPKTVEKIGCFAFGGSSIYEDDRKWENNVLYIDDCLISAKEILDNSYSIIEGTRLIADLAFINCELLTSVYIPDSVVNVGRGTFCYCKQLNSVRLSKNIEYISDLIFEEESCGFFEGCSSLISFSLPERVSNIEISFVDCKKLTSIEVSPGNPNYDSRDNCNGIIETKTNTLIASCKNTIIPDSVTSIGECAFSDCSGLTSIVIPDSVTSIGRLAFCHCSGLTSIVIPDSVTSIGEDAFYGCSGLKEIRIPKGTRDKLCAMPELKKYENLLVEYKKEEKEKCATPESEEFRILTNLAKAYELGIGVAKNYTQAILFYTQAAEKGSAEAAYKLAEWYAAGEQLPKDYEKAMQFYQQAAKSAFSDAKQKVEQLQKKIDEENERLQNFMQEEWKEREKQQLLNNKETILFFDTETNGLPGNYKLPPSSTYNWPRVLQLGWIITDVDGNVRKEKSVYIYPDGFEVTAEVTKLTGITTSHLRQFGEDIADVLEEFMSDVMSVTKVIGHNVNYDKKVLASELYRPNKDYNSLLNKPSVCTMERTTNWCAIPNPNSYYGGYKYPKLQELYAKLFGKNFTDAHDALADIRATKECYFELIERGIIK